jgi:hypothetical protein
MRFEMAQPAGRFQDKVGRLPPFQSVKLTGMCQNEWESGAKHVFTE